MRFLIFALGVVVLFSGCGDPCSSRETRAAWIGAGGPVGLVAALALSCAPPEQPGQIAAIPTAGLTEQTEQPDMGAPADMEERAPDLSPLVCGPLFVVSVDGRGAQFCDADRDGDAVADRIDGCPTLSAGQVPDPARRGCPAPRTYTITLPPAAFAAGGNIDLHDGTATSRPDFDWAALRHSPATLSSLIYFQNSSANATNSVKFELVGTADFSAPRTTVEACAAFKDRLHQDAVTRPPNDVACVARGLALCPVDLVSPASKLAGEQECAKGVSGGAGYWSAGNAPVKLTAKVDSADWISSEPMPVAGIEIQVLLSGAVKLSDWSVVATITETLR